MMKNNRKLRLLINGIVVTIFVTILLPIGIWQAFLSTIEADICKNVYIIMKSDDDALLYVNGSMVLNATDPTKTYKYNISCVLTGYYSIAVKSKGTGKPNGFIASVFYGNTEISYTGDGKWLGIDGDAIGDWISNFDYDDSGWITMDITNICDLSPGINNSKSKYVNLPDCSTDYSLISLRLKLSFSNGKSSVPMPVLGNQCQSLTISSKFYYYGDVYVNGKFIYRADDSARTYRYSIPCAFGQYLIAILATGLGGFNGYALSVSLGNIERSYTGAPSTSAGGKKFKGIFGNATGDWISNPKYNDSSWTDLGLVVAYNCYASLSTDIPNSIAKYAGLPYCYTFWETNSIRLIFIA